MARLKSRWLTVALLILSVMMGCFGERLAAKTEANEGDMAGIEKLHQQDIAATLANDPKALSELWTDSAVRMEPGGLAEVSKATIYANDKKQKTEHPGAKMLSYAPEIEDIQIKDGWAYEWGYFSGSYQASASEQAQSFRGKLLRVLRKQSDGSWKFDRVMWNLAE